MIKRNAAQPGRNNINRLPDEILCEIFIQYHYMRNGSAVCFLRVCRIWKNIVSSTSALWSRICFVPMPIFKLFENLSVIRLVHQLHHLPSTGTRHPSTPQHEIRPHMLSTPGFLPDRCIILDGLELVWFEQQCRSLCLMVGRSLDRFRHMFHKMGALEEFLLPDINDSYLNMFHGLELFSPRLHTLELQGGIPSEISQFTVLLSRLKILSLQPNHVPSRNLHDLLGGATSLEELNLDSSALSDFPTQLNPCSDKLREITLLNAGISLFTVSGTYARVVDLEVRFANQKSWPSNKNHLEIEMPVLQNLVLEGKWTALRCI